MTALWSHHTEHPAPLKKPAPLRDNPLLPGQAVAPQAAAGGHIPRQRLLSSRAGQAQASRVPGAPALAGGPHGEPSRQLDQAYGRAEGTLRASDTDTWPGRSLRDAVTAPFRHTPTCPGVPHASLHLQRRPQRSWPPLPVPTTTPLLLQKTATLPQEGKPKPRETTRRLFPPLAQPERATQLPLCSPSGQREPSG